MRGGFVAPARPQHAAGGRGCAGGCRVRRRNIYLAKSILFWLLTGTVFWWFLDTVKAGCELRWRDSGLWAECFAPAGLIYGLAFLLLLAVDVLRTILAFRMRRDT